MDDWVGLLWTLSLSQHSAHPSSTSSPFPREISCLPQSAWSAACLDLSLSLLACYWLRHECGILGGQSKCRLGLC